jgi:hypothetical protein
MIDKLVYECIAQHEGGEKFFDELDKRLAGDKQMFARLITFSMEVMDNLFCDELSPDDTKITFILSGKFGESHRVELEKKFKNIPKLNSVVLEGGLRFNEIFNTSQYKSEIENSYCVFLDDSYFEGRTYGKVKKMIEDNNGVCVGCFVAYDGGKLRHTDVHSLFRYYDNFGNDKNREMEI